MTKLTFSKGNRKLNDLSVALQLKKTQVVGFDLPAGYTCPKADKCLSFSNRVSGKITDGKSTQFRCYAASIESAFTSVRKSHWQNYDSIKDLNSDDIASLILSELPKNVKVVRIHASGDFFSKDYFIAWTKVAEKRPDVSFFGYTKVLNYVSAEKPQNFKLVYSFGGKMDSQLKSEPVAYVVPDASYAQEHNLIVACPPESPSDDYFHILNGISFALCLHGTQPAKSKA